MNKDTILLIGPCRAGKTTLGPIIATKLNIPSISIDDVGYNFKKEIYIEGDNTILNNYLEKKKFMKFYKMTRRYELHAVKRTLETYNNCVIDFGAGNSVYDDAAQFDQIKNIVSNYQFVFHILPKENLDESLIILNKRTDYPLHLATNEFLIKHPSNFDLANYTIYTEGKTPQETADEIVNIFQS